MLTAEELMQRTAKALRACAHVVSIVPSPIVDRWEIYSADLLTEVATHLRTEFTENLDKKCNSIYSINLVESAPHHEIHKLLIKAKEICEEQYAYF